MKKTGIILLISFLIFSGCVYAPKQAWKPGQPVKEQTQTYQPVYIKPKKKKEAKKTVKEEAGEEEAKTHKKSKKQKKGDNDNKAE